MTIQMPELIGNINKLRPIVEWWWHNRHTPTGRAMLTAEKQVHSDLSVQHGGGRTPFYHSRQAAVAKTNHNTHITSWEQVVTFHEAANFSGIVNLCPWSTPQCRKHCLGHTAGRMPMTNNRIAQRVRTHHLVNHTLGSLIIQLDEAERHARRIHKCGKLAAWRPNGDSDIPWELAAWFLALTHTAGIDQIFDYTKGVERTESFEYQTLIREWNVRYHLAVSATEKTQPADLVGGMVVIVDIRQNDPIPATYGNFDTIDGDWENGDLRFLDNPTKLCLIRKKGSLKKEVGHWNNFCKPATCNPKLQNTTTPDTLKRTRISVTAA